MRGRLLLPVQNQRRLWLRYFAACRPPPCQKGDACEGKQQLCQLIAFLPVEKVGEGFFKIIGLHRITSVEF